MLGLRTWLSNERIGIKTEYRRVIMSLHFSSQLFQHHKSNSLSFSTVSLSITPHFISSQYNYLGNISTYKNFPYVFQQYSTFSYFDFFLFLMIFFYLLFSLFFQFFFFSKLPNKSSSTLILFNLPHHFTFSITTMKNNHTPIQNKSVRTPLSCKDKDNENFIG